MANRRRRIGLELGGVQEQPEAEAGRPAAGQGPGAGRSAAEVPARTRARRPKAAFDGGRCLDRRVQRPSRTSGTALSAGHAEMQPRACRDHAWSCRDRQTRLPGSQRALPRLGPGVAAIGTGVASGWPHSTRYNTGSRDLGERSRQVSACTAHLRTPRSAFPRCERLIRCSIAAIARHKSGKVGADQGNV